MMGFFENLGDSMRKKFDERGRDIIRNNRNRLSDEQLLDVYARDTGLYSRDGSKSRNALRDELRRRGYRDLD